MSSIDTLSALALFEAGKTAQDSCRWDDALASYGRLLAMLPDSDAEQRIDVMRRIGTVRFHRGDLELAGKAYQESYVAAQAHGSGRNVASALNGLASVYQALGQLDRAEETYRQAYTAAEAAGHARLSVMIEQNLGTIASVRGDTAEALRCYHTALQRYEASHDKQGVSWVLNNIGMVYTHLEDWRHAEEALDRALLLAQERQDPEMFGTVQLNRAELYLQQDRFDDARACADQAFETFGRLGSRRGLGETYKLYGSLFRAAGKLHLADAHLGVVSELAEQAEYMLLLAESLAEHALVHLELGRNADALRALNRGHRVFADLRARRELLDIETRLNALEQNYLQVVSAWGESIESKDQYTAGHCQRVADLTCRLAEAVGISGRDLTWMRMGAFLHDVGKTAVDAAVLNKPGKLTEEEWAQMRNHTIAGDAIVKELDFPWDIRPIVRNHHERWDGTGYPDRLQGEEIPLAARILCVADIYDALTTTRSYRTAYTAAEALSIMESESGTTLDPSLFAVFQRLLAESTEPVLNAVT